MLVTGLVLLLNEKSGTVKRHSDWKVQDLPGIYSMSPYTPEEKVARDYLLVIMRIAFLMLLIRQTGT